MMTLAQAEQRVQSLQQHLRDLADDHQTSADVLIGAYTEYTEAADELYRLRSRILCAGELRTA